jgi:hypothetical protein
MLVEDRLIDVGIASGLLVDCRPRSPAQICLSHASSARWLYSIISMACQDAHIEDIPLLMGQFTMAVPQFSCLCSFLWLLPVETYRVWQGHTGGGQRQLLYSKHETNREPCYFRFSCCVKPKLARPRSTFRCPHVGICTTRILIHIQPEYPRHVRAHKAPCPAPPLSPTYLHKILGLLLIYLVSPSQPQNAV